MLFWGAMTGRPFIGLVCALAVEARHWTRIRWEFDDESYERAWQFTSIAIALTTVLIWLDGNRYTALPSLLTWMPPLLLPLQFVQSYGMRDSLPLGMFSFLAKRRRIRNQRLGLIEDTTHFNFGNVLLVVTLVAATVGTKSDTWLFLPALVVLCGWALLSAGRSRPVSLAPVLIVAGALAVAGQFGLERAERWIGNRSGEEGTRFDPNFNNTLIGNSGAVQQSTEIVWRLRTEGRSMPPPRLRTAAFSNFYGTNWQNQPRDFNELDSRIIADDNYYLLQETIAAKDLDKLPAYSLRGAVVERAPLPLPGDAAGLRGLDQDWVERNSLGTVRIFPKHPVIDTTVFWNGGTNPEPPPLANEDLQIPPAEREIMHDVAESLHLADAPDLQAKLTLLRNWFQREFRYTRNLTIRQPSIRDRLGSGKAPTALAQFLTDVRAGHCEYFATAATLLLRETGVHTRYAIGYAVMERDMKRGGYVIRGTHGHAWCRVWDGDAGVWLDFDPTPPDWFATVYQTPTRMQLFGDFVKRIREDFYIWRTRPDNQLAVSLVFAGIGLVLSIFVLRRLWRSRRQIAHRIEYGDYPGPVVRTPLHALESQARRHLGQRPPGKPFAEWLAGLRGAIPEPPVLDEALLLHQRIRFDPAAPPAEHRERLAELSRSLESALKTMRRG